MKIYALTFTGDFLVVGTEHPYVRFYDVMSGACFVAAETKNQVG